MTGKLVAAVNRKGGVGKTTLVIAIADTIVSEFKASVIVVDADPQASASIALIGPGTTLKRSEEKRSLASAIDALAKDQNANMRRSLLARSIALRAGLRSRSLWCRTGKNCGIWNSI